MLSFLQQFFNSLAKPKTYLLLANVLLVFFLIILTNLGILPFQNFGDFMFFSVIGLALALYRPGWAFLFFVGTIALENINVAPKGFFVDIRPYQFFGAITIAALVIRYFSKRLNFKLAKLKWFDYALIIFAIAGFLCAMFAADKVLALKQSVIMLSFVFLYFLVLNFVQTLSDLKKIIPFFLSSSIIVVIYGIWQNIAFSKGLNSFEAMPGRPNSTFTEADWLGIFVTLLIAVLYSILFYNSKNSELNGDAQIFNSQFSIFKFKIFNLFLYLLLATCYIILILTVSRSAWLGVGIATIIFLKIILTDAKFNPKYWRWKEFWKQSGLIISAGIVSMLCVYTFHMTNFQLFNRAASAGSGLQKITISCYITNCSSPSNNCVDQKYIEPGSIIKNNDELLGTSCHQINLEEIENEKAKGFKVLEIYRQDPNVSIRSQIYQKSWEEIKSHPVLGIGWGNIGKILGTDERGTILNSSNIFLEIWLGSGIFGLLAFLTILGYIFIRSVINLLRENIEDKILGLFTILGFMALFIPNLFNAGVFLGILWVFLAIAMI